MQNRTHIKLNFLVFVREFIVTVVMYMTVL